MNEEEIKAITLEGLQESFGEISVNNEMFSENSLSQSIGLNKYRIDVKYHFTQSQINGKEGVSLIYTAQGNTDFQIQEATTLFTGHLDYDIKGAIDEMAKLDLPIIHHYFSKEPMDEEKLTYLEAVYYNPFQSPAIVQGWKAYVGMQKRLDDERAEYISPKEEQALFHVLYGAINQVLFPRPQPYFIKCWVTLVQKEGLWADCRVNMQDWEQGRDLLYEYAESWEMTGQKRSLKQVLFLVPTPLEELKNGEKILNQIKNHFQEDIKERSKEPEQSKKKFWEFWK